MKVISSEKMPKSKGHYSMVMEHDGMLYLSGQLPIDMTTGDIPESIEEQTSIVLYKVKVILEEAGLTLQHVLQVRIYLSDIALWDRVNKVYSVFFGDHKPVRTVVPTGPLHYGSSIEIEATAVRDVNDVKSTLGK